MAAEDSDTTPVPTPSAAAGGPDGCKGCGSLSPPLFDESRDESHCPDCGYVLSETLYDYDSPSLHGWDAAEGINPGRSVAQRGRAKFSDRDGQGVPIGPAAAKRFRGLERAQRRVDQIVHSRADNRVVERAVRDIRALAPYHEENAIKRSRRLLMDVHRWCEGNGQNLFKGGSPWNSAAAALVCMNQGSDNASLRRRVDDYSGRNSLSSKQKKSLTRRAMAISRQVALYQRNYDGYKFRQTSRFVIPHPALDGSGGADILPQLDNQIGDWLDRRRSSLLMVRASFPEADDVLGCVSKVIDDPRVIGLSGGELLEPVLDAILLVLADKSNPELNRCQIAEQAGMSASVAKYTHRVHTLMAERRE